MPYPSASLKESWDLAQTIDKLGGQCHKKRCAETLGKSLSGAYQTLISSAVKYGFISNKQELLSITEKYREIKLTYTEIEKRNKFQEAFLGIPLFRQVYETYKENSIPAAILPKVLIKEFAVSEKDASRVSRYFIENLRWCGFLENQEDILPFEELSLKTRPEENKSKNTEIKEKISEEIKFPENSHSSLFHIALTGPGFKLEYDIRNADDIQFAMTILSHLKTRFPLLK